MARRFKALVVNGVLVLVALGLALAVAEVAVRALNPQPTGLSHQDRYGLPMHWPGITRYLPQYGHEVTFNSVGMRDIEHPTEKPADVYRILLLGDSFMEALQVPFDSSFPSHLTRMLGRVSGRRVEVINAGVSGWGTDDELRYLTRYGRPYRADLVLVAMTLHNDLSDNARETWHRLEGDSLVEQNPQPIPWRTYQILKLKGWISTRFQTYQLWRRVRHGGEIARVGRQLNRHVIDLFQDPSPERITNSTRLSAKLLGEIKAVAEADGGHMALVLLPLRYQLADTMFTALAASAGEAGKTMRIERPQQLIRPIAESLGVLAVDLLPAFRQWSDSGGPSLYVEWDGHWNAAGHHLAAQVTAGQLASALAAPAVAARSPVRTPHPPGHRPE